MAGETGDEMTRRNDTPRCLRALGAAMVLAFLALLPLPAFSQMTYSGPVEMYAENIDLYNLALPGTPFTVKVKLGNTRDTERRLRAIVVRDGRLADVPPLKAAYLDEYDQPTYELQIFSPLAELSYQFVLYNPDGTFSTTPRHTVRRQCIPFIDIEQITLEPKSQGEARLDALVKLSRGLEREVAAYDTAVKLLQGMSERFKQ
jgi:hypothetical protein